jgi:hypothetical protein
MTRTGFGSLEYMGKRVACQGIEPTITNPNQARLVKMSCCEVQEEPVVFQGKNCFPARFNALPTILTFGKLILTFLERVQEIFCS